MHPELQEPLVQLERRELEESSEPQAVQEHRVFQELLDHKVQLDRLVVLVLKVCLVQLGHQV